MRIIKTRQVVLTLALLVSIAAFFALRAPAADERGNSSNRFRVTVMDVVGGEDSVVKQIRIDAIANSLARITSDQVDGGGVATSAGSVEDRPEEGTITVAVLAVHVEWEAGSVNALKFLMSIDGGSSKALMSNTGPMVTGKQLSDIFSVSLKSGTYEYGTAIPVVRFKDRTFSLTVAAPASEP